MGDQAATAKINKKTRGTVLRSFVRAPTPAGGAALRESQGQAAHSAHGGRDWPRVCCYDSAGVGHV